MQLFTNNATSVLAAGITSVATSLTVATGDGAKFPNPTVGDTFLVTLYKLSGVTETSYEIVKCTARVGDTLTVVRAQEGTTGTAYATGDNVALRLTAGSMSTDAIAEGNNKYFTVARVLSSALTGLSLVSNQAVAATDTVLQAIGYLQKQITDAVSSLAAKAPIANPSFTGKATFVSTKTTKVPMNSGTSIDLEAGELFTKTISSATTLSLANVPGSGVAAFMLDLTNGGSATITWWSGIKWPGGTAPTLTVSGRDTLGFFTHDGGTTWTGLVLGKDIK
ncbi:hypothetical protein [Undibacterium umbellatum]|uniref:Tail fiber protein n=1 Tax=Undibacterium umbellatum TaxID=2762300 RepID=A0ABR6Z3U2_9BURK|nr:hypothetical protein [Undibacterium umbellatum]MBC3906204.1 hypothetical protein [Undibacterium umbellatum]